MIEWIEPVKNFKAGDNKWKYREFLARNSRYFCQGMLIESAGNDYHLYVNKVFLYVSLLFSILSIADQISFWPTAAYMISMVTGWHPAMYGLV